MRRPTTVSTPDPNAAMYVSRGAGEPASFARGSSSRMPPASDGTKSLARSRISRSVASSRTSQCSVSWSRRARTKKRAISSADSVKMGPGGTTGVGIDSSSVRVRSGTPGRCGGSWSAIVYGPPYFTPSDDVGGFGIEGGPVRGPQPDPALQVGDDDVADVDAVQLVHRVDAPGREHVQLQDAVTDDIDGDEGQPVRQQLWTQDVADARLDRAERRLAARRRAGAGGAAVGRAGGAPPVDRDAIADADRLRVEQQQAFFPLLGLGQVLLRQRVAVFGHRRDDL